MQFSASTSAINTPAQKPEKRGAGRAANLLHLPNYTADILLEENTLQPGTTQEIVERSATSAMSSTTASNGSLGNSLMKKILALQSASTMSEPVNVHGVPTTSAGWKHIIERHCVMKYNGLKKQELELRKRRLELLVSSNSKENGTKRNQVAHKLYEITKNTIFKTA